MPYINVHVDLDDIYDDMCRSDKEMMAEWLCDDGFVVMMNEDFYSLLMSNPIAVAISDDSLVAEGWTYDGSEFFEPTAV